jgi:hypothetical protein
MTWRTFVLNEALILLTALFVYFHQYDIAVFLFGTLLVIRWSEE